MGYLSSIEDPQTNDVLYTFKPVNIHEVTDLKRRSGTYTVMGADFGVDPWGQNALPLDVRHLSYDFDVILPFGGDVDGARDALLSIVARGRAVRLVYVTDRKKERIVTAKMVEVRDEITPLSPIIKHFTVVWEILALWRDRYPRNAKVWGVGGGTTLHWGQAAPVLHWGDIFTAFTGIDNNFGVFADGTDGLEIPSADDEHPTVRINGPFGGDVVLDANGNYVTGGFVVYNNTTPGASVLDFSGNPQPTQFTVYRKLAGGESCTIDAASRDVLINGAPAYSRFLAPDWQTQWMQVVAKQANVIRIATLGANPVYYADAVQQVAIVGISNVSGQTSTFTLTVTTPDGVSQTTVANSVLTNAATLQANLTALTNVGLGNLVVTGGPGPNNPFYIGFINALGAARIPAITSTGTFSGGTTPAIVIAPTSAYVLVTTGIPTGGTFTLTVATEDGATKTTAAIPYNATASAVAYYLSLLSNVGTNVVVSPALGQLPNQALSIAFTGDLTGHPVTLTAGYALTGGYNPVAAALTQNVGGTGSFAFEWFGYYY